MTTIAALLAGVALTTSAPADDPPAPDAKAAVEKALKRIEKGVINYPKHRQCFSCHHQAMAVLSMTAARQRGFTVDDDLLKKQIDFSLRTFRNRSMIAKGQGVTSEERRVG